MIRHRLAALVVLLALLLGASPALAGGRAARTSPGIQPGAWTAWLWQQVSHLVSFVGKAHGSMDPNGDPANGILEVPTSPPEPGGTDAQGTLGPDGSYW